MVTKTKMKKTTVDEVRDSARQVWLAGLGTLSFAEKEGTKLFKTLVKEGKGFERRSKKQLESFQGKVEERVDDVRDAAESTWDRVESTVDDRVASTLNRLGVPSRHEIQRLTKRVEELTTKVDSITRKPKPKPKPKTSRAARA